MATEIYRIEIPILVDDKSEEPIERVRTRVSRLEQEALKRNRMIRKHFETIAKMRIEPVMRVRDRLTAGVLKADRLLKVLNAEQAAPVLTAQDKVSAVVLRVNQLLDALEKNNVNVIADLKGPLMKEITEARAALVALSKVQAQPVAELRGKLYAQLTRAMTLTRQLDQIKMEPQAALRESVTAKTREITTRLHSLTSRVWTITLKVGDAAGGVLSKFTGFLTHPLTLLGVGGGLTASLFFPLKLAGEMDRYRRGVEAFSDSAEAGRKNFEELLLYAAKSPVYELPFVTKIAGSMLAQGFDLEYAKRALDLFGRAAMYTGATLEDLKLAFRGFLQIASKGTLQMEEFYQVTENLNLPPAWIYKELGLTGAALKDIGKQGIPAARAMEAFLKAIEKRMPAIHYNEDLLAQATQLKETAWLAVWQFGEGMRPYAQGILKDLTNILDPASEKFMKFTEKLRFLGTEVGRYLENAYGRIKDFTTRLLSSKEWEQADWPLKMSMLLDAVLSTAVPKAGEVGVKIGYELARGMIKGINDLAVEHPLLSAAVAAWATPGPLPVKAAVGAMTAVGYGTANLARKFKREYELTNATNKLNFNPGIRALESLPGYQSGGILTRPHIGMVAEAGPEAIIPLSARMRSRALALWERTGQLLGTLPAAPATAIAGGLPLTAPAPVGTSSVTHNVVHIHMDGAVKNTINMKSMDDLHSVVDNVAAILAERLKSVFTNMPRR